MNKKGEKMSGQRKTKHWFVDKSLNNVETDPAILAAADQLQRDEVIAFPTETVYGLGGNARSDEAIEKIFLAKGRPSDNPLIVHIASLQAVADIVAHVSETAEQLMTAFWPGPLTIIFPKGKGMSDRVTAGLQTVAIRMPNDPIALALIKAAQLPVAAPSANRSGRPSPTTAEHVMADLDGKIAGVIDGGTTAVGVESTVVECGEGHVTILRPGGITQAQLEAIGVDVVEAPSGNEGEHPKSPGMKYTHYSPKAPLLLVAGNKHAIQKVVDGEKQAGKCVGVLTTEEKVAQYKADVVLACGQRRDLTSVAAELYRTLRQFDALGVDTIVSEAFPRKGIGNAIMNRLEKAATTIIS